MKARLTLAVLAAVFLILVLPAPAPAANEGALYVKGAKREAAQARQAYREAVKVLRATRRYSTHDYSDFAGRYVEPVKVGRWVRLARRVGWPWSCIDRLMHIIARESSGYPGVLNSQGSGAAGLLQLMPGWYQGSWGAPAGDPSSPRYNLRTGLWIYRHGGWSAWSL